MSTTAPSAPTGTIEHIDPNSIVIETNVRTSVTLDPEFLASIRQNGILVPPFGWRDSNGNINVRGGQRRTLAAREVGLPTMPVYVIDGTDDTARRIIEQLVENEHRAALDDTERVEAWKQLEIAGLSVAQIAKRTGTKRDRIKTGLTVAASATGTNLIANVGLTLDQAADLIEFEDDPEVVARLTEIAINDPGYYPVAVQRERNERAAAALREKTEAEHAAKGHRILSQAPAWNDPTPYLLHQVTDHDGNHPKPEDIDGKPGIAVYVNAWNADSVKVTYYVDDPEAAGLTLRADTQSATKGPMTDEQKAERKTLIANNKEWDAAETVRREWLASLISRKTLPKNAPLVIATLMASARHKVSDGLSRGNGLAKTLLGLENTYGTQIDEHLTAHPTRATHITLAIVLGGIEEHTSRDTWRNPQADTAAYLRTLAGWGYTLCPVEKIAAMIDAD